MNKHIVYHIPVCPFSQRLEILLELRGMQDAVEFRVVDITKPRDPELLRKTRGTTALPVLETAEGHIIKESLVILRYLDEVLEGPRLRRADPREHAIESMLIAKEGPFTMAGYIYVMNQDRAQKEAHNDKLLSLYRDLNDFLMEHNPDGTFLFEEFSLAEAVFAPVFKRFWFLDYYEGFELPVGPEYERVKKWRAACMAHEATDQVSEEEIVKLYYDYALGAGNGALVEGRSVSSFAFQPEWQSRPMPPRDKYETSATDVDLGLVEIGAILTDANSQQTYAHPTSD
ncbi:MULTISPECIES: glutathione S-transferase family protein [unclassified Ruegeria]|uniref:glutathione S-transferase family protein n=1 Tax=unclassified Ruegeria TaxID=2625375 RepID=UPI0014915EF7|nr:MULTISPECIES: glutathione S-transferase family protein [unclassified Ruegeria]NOD47235.1 glutathione S-transferase family protein [Ruegeria sp. HKCCD5849]NOD51558.1 glutathione S-transferase family protein [Ruegeria sp. HKCCD5851]NOD69297.1 glutathione S-transferase family protein [Ruegeria sp. HKCCD7303]